jgi:CBS domain-containing protein
MKPPAKGKVLDERARVPAIALARHPRVDVASVRSVLIKKPAPAPCIDADSPLSAALALFDEGEALAVVAAGKVCGTLSAADVARAWMAFGELARARPVGAAMSACAITVTPAQTVEDCLRIASEYGLRFLPVVDADASGEARDPGRPIALLSLEHLLEEKIEYLARVCKESDTDQRVYFLRGTYSC